MLQSNTFHQGLDFLLANRVSLLLIIDKDKINNAFTFINKKSVRDDPCAVAISFVLVAYRHTHFPQSTAKIIPGIGIGGKHIVKLFQVILERLVLLNKTLCLLYESRLRNNSITRR